MTSQISNNDQPSTEERRWIRSVHETPTVIDSHFHNWMLSRGDYGWLTPELRDIYRDYTLDDWQLEVGNLGVEAGILVQAAPTEAETDFLLEIANQRPDIVLGVVGWTDFEATDVARRIERLAEDPLLVGLRPMLQDIADPSWIDCDRARRATEAMARASLTFDALIRPAHIPYIHDLAARLPELTIVIDHGAKPQIERDAFGEWAAALSALAMNPSMYCKLSGLWTETAPSAPVSDIQPWADHVLDVFGTERTLWGSDWPVVRLAGPAASWYEYAQRLVAKRGDDAVRNVFSTNAQRAYRIGRIALG